MNAIEMLFTQPMILATELRSVCGVTTNGTKTKSVLLKYAREIAHIDIPNIALLTDENLIEEYSIEILPEAPSKQQTANYTIDHRIALALAIDADKPKGAEDDKKYVELRLLLNKYARGMWTPALPPRGIEIKTEPKPLVSSNPTSAQNDHLNPGKTGFKETLSTGTNLDQNEIKIEPISSNPTSAQNDHLNPVFPGFKETLSTGTELVKTIANSDEIYFPKYGVKRSCKAIRDFLMVHIKNNINDATNDNMISINSMINAAGLRSDDVKLNRWNDTDSAREIIDGTMRLTGLPQEKVYRSVQGRGGGTWANIFVAFDIAKWMCVDFGIMVSSIAINVMGGKLAMIAVVADNHEAMTNTAATIFRAPAANDTQMPQISVISLDRATITPDQQAGLEKQNDQVAGFNHKALRRLDYSKPLPRSLLYKCDDDTQLQVINGAAVNGTNIERALVTLYPEVFEEKNGTTLYEMLEIMWNKIAWFEKQATISSYRGQETVQLTKRFREIDAKKARMHIADDLSQPTDVIIQEERKEIEKLDDDYDNKTEEYKRTITGLTAHIAQLTAAHNLAPLIEQLIKPKAKKSRAKAPVDEPERGCYPSYMNYANPSNSDNSENLRPLHDLLAGMLDAPAHGAINELNWWMTSKIGVNFDEHIGFRNAIKVIRDIYNILTADLSAGEFNPRVQPNFGYIFQAEDARDIEDQSPAYYHELAAVNIKLNFQSDRNHNSEFDFDGSGNNDTKSESSDFTSTSSLPGNIDMCDPYATVAYHLGTSVRSEVTGHKLKSKSSKVGRGQIIDRVGDLSPPLRLAVTRALEDFTSTVGPNVSRPADVHALNIYIGQEGYALRITPKITSGIARLCVFITIGNILDAGAWHMRPGGQIILIKPLTGENALAKLLRGGIPGSRSASPAMFMLTRDYVSSDKSTLGEMIRAIVTAIGHAHVASITYPRDQLGHSWRVATPGDASW